MTRFAFITLAASLLLGLAGADAGAQAPSDGPDSDPIAVLPFTNLSPDPRTPGWVTASPRPSRRSWQREA